MDIVPQADSAAIRAACAELSALHPWYAPRYRLAAIILLRGAWRLEHGALFVDGARYHPETGCSCQEAGFVECVHKIGHAILAAALVAAPHPTPPATAWMSTVFGRLRKVAAGEATHW